jgi:hypothetical protein
MAEPPADPVCDITERRQPVCRQRKGLGPAYEVVFVIISYCQLHAGHDNQEQMGSLGRRVFVRAVAHGVQYKGEGV